MKILALRGRNLASLAGDFAVDFEHGALGRAGLFAISGPTGAGKSTLLDAICLALFDKTPRLSDGKSSYAIPDVRDESIGVSDARTVLRRGAPEGYAEVEFDGNDGVRYRARWSVARARRKPGGRLQNTTIELVNVVSGQSLGGTKGEVLDRIQQAIGLSFEQFRRSVLLAQGDFAAFLQARGDERAALLERMTGTEIYSVLGSRAYRRAEDEKRALEAKEAEQRGIEMLAPPARAEAQARIQALEAEIAAMATEAGVLRAGETWWKTLADLELHRDQATQRFQGVEQAWHAAASRREALAQVEAVQPLRASAEAATRTASEAKRAAAQVAALATTLAAARSAQARATAGTEAAAAALEKARADDAATSDDRRQARALDATLLERRRGVEDLAGKLKTAANEQTGIARERAVLDAKRTKLLSARDAARAWHEANPASVTLARAWDATSTLLDQYVDGQQAHRLASDSIAQASKQLTIDEAQRSGALAAWDGTRTALEAASAQVATAEAAERALPDAPLRARRAAAQARQAVVDSLAGLRQRAIDAEARRSKKATEAAKADADAAALDVKAKAEAATVAAAGAELAETVRQLEILDLAAHRALLVDGQPCPLCGSTAHPGVGPIDLAADVLAKQRTALDKRIEQASKAETRHQTAAEGLRKNATAARAEADAAAADRACIRADWIDAAGKLAGGLLPEPVAEQANRFVADHKAAVQAELGQIDSEVTRLDGLRQAAEHARRERDAAERAERAAKSALDAAGKKRDATARTLREAEQQREHAQAMLARSIASLTPCFTDEPGWADALAADAAAFGKRCKLRVGDAGRQATALAQADKELGELEPPVAAMAANLDRLGTQIAAITTELAARRLELQADEAYRGRLLGGRPVDQVEQGLRQAIDAAGLALKQQEAALSEARAAGLRDEGLLAQADRQAAAASRSADEAAQVLALAMSEAGLDRATLDARLALTPAWISQQRTELQRLDGDRTTAAALVASRGLDRDRHAATERPSRPREEIVAAISTLDARHGAANQELGAARNRIADDDRHRQRAAGLRAEIDEMRGRNAAWARLSELIGSADGKKFRTFAQSLTLDLLLAHANSHLADLAPRYRLQRVPALDLELQVVDRDMGDEVRATNSLSGGETFLASLALALGLSSLASERVRIDSLFIDEGFGSLDSQTLETALATLDALQAAGRKVGLISHVPGLAERIGVQVRVDKHGQGRSSVQVISA